MQIKKMLFLSLIILTNKIFCGGDFRQTCEKIEGVISKQAPTAEDFIEAIRTLEEKKSSLETASKYISDQFKANSVTKFMRLTPDQMRQKLERLTELQEGFKEMTAHRDITTSLQERLYEKLRSNTAYVDAVNTELQARVENVNTLARLLSLLEGADKYNSNHRFLDCRKLEDCKQILHLFDLESKFLESLEKSNLEQEKQLAANHIRPNLALYGLLGQSFQWELGQPMLSALMVAQASEKEEQRLLMLLAKKALKNRDERLEVARAVLSNVYKAVK